MFVVATAGLPGSGKSTLARALGRALAAPVFDKDRVRAALYAPDHVEYSREQDDLVCAALHALIALEARRGLRPAVVLDGRTYSLRAQVDALGAAVREAGAELVLFHCVCSPQVAARRVETDRGTHPATDRGPELVHRVAERFEPLEVPHRVLDTEHLSPLQALTAALAHLAERGLPVAAR